MKNLLLACVFAAVSFPAGAATKDYDQCEYRKPRVVQDFHWWRSACSIIGNLGADGALLNKNRFVTPEVDPDPETPPKPEPEPLPEDETDEEATDAEGSDDQGSDDEGSDDQGSDDEGSDDQGSDEEDNKGKPRKP